jgi:hypothetical protein
MALACSNVALDGPPNFTGKLCERDVKTKTSRSRYVPVRRNFVVYCVFGVSKNQ